MKMVNATMNGRWPIILPEHRAARPVNDWWEAQRLAAMHSRIRHHPTNDMHRPHVLDVGAEEGDFSCLMSMWGADVFLVEPNPKAWSWIRSTFEANNQKPHGWFVGLLASESDLELPSGTGWTWSHSNRHRWPDCADDGEPTPEHGFHHIAEHSEVDAVTTLDVLVSAGGWVPDIITMDVEGGELHCLMGAERTLSEHRPEVFVSIHPEFLRDLYGQSKDDVLDLMAGHNYRAQFICSDHEEHYFFSPLENPWPWSDPHDHTQFQR